MTREGLTRVVSLLAEEYGIEFSADRRDLWFAELHDVTDAQGRGAVIRLIRSSPYPPKVADIRRMVFGTPDDQDRALDEEAELALRHITEHVCDHRINDWCSPVLHAFARQLGGVEAIVAMMASGEWRMRWRDHRMLYRAIRRRGVSADSPEAAALTPQAISEGLVDFGLEKYAGRGLSVPIEIRPFAPPTLPALPTSGRSAMDENGTVSRGVLAGSAADSSVAQQEQAGRWGH